MSLPAEARAVLAGLEACDIATVSAAVDNARQLLHPLLPPSRPSVDELRGIARTLGPLATGLVKSLASIFAAEGRGSNHQRWFVLGEAVCIALDALDGLRPVLKASRQDLDAQRYSFVRKLATKGLHQHALLQGKALVASLFASPHGAQGEASVPSDLHIAAITNLLICYCELVQQEPRRAAVLWADINSPLDSLLTLAREAQPTPGQAPDIRLEPLLRCIGKAMELLFETDALAAMGSSLAAQQLAALVSCADLCGQLPTVEQRLFEEVAAAADSSVLARILEALLGHLGVAGNLHATLRVLLHHVGVRAVQLRLALSGKPDGQGEFGPEDMVRVAFALLHSNDTALRGHSSCSSAVPNRPVEAALAPLEGAVGSLQAAIGKLQGTEGRWLWWCCLDILRLSVSGILQQLLAAPQDAGVHLRHLAKCMELLATGSLELLADAPTPASAQPVASSGSAAAVLAARLHVAHCCVTGQLSSLQDGVSRNLQLLRQLLPELAQQHNGLELGSATVDPSVLQSLSAGLGNAGLDLLQGQHTAPAAELLQAAAELALRRSQLLFSGMASSACSSAGGTSSHTVKQLIKKCKVHVAALVELSAHEAAMVAAVRYIPQLHRYCHDRLALLSSLVKLHVRAQLAIAAAAAEALAARACASSLPQPAAGPITSAPAAPRKGARRGGRLQRIQADDTQNESAAGAPAPSGTGRGAGTVPSAPIQPPSLVEALGTICSGKAGGPVCGLREALDVYAMHELEHVAEECKREGGAAANAFQPAHAAAVTGTLSRVASSPIAVARAALVEVVAVPGKDGSSCTAKLRAVCTTLDEAVAQAGVLSGPGSGARDAEHVGLADTAALAHALLAAALVQQQPTDAAVEQAYQCVDRALELWGWLLEARAPPLLRLPHASLHAAMQIVHLVQLHGCAKPPVVARSASVVWRLVRVLSTQTKLTDQQVHALCATSLGSTCTAWAAAPQPWPVLGCAAALDGELPAKLHAVVQLLQPLMDQHVSAPYDHVAVAQAAEAAAGDLDRGAFLRHGPAPLLLRSRCHHAAAAAYLKAGDTAGAFTHAQEALRITCALFALLDRSEAGSGGGAKGPAASSGKQGRRKQQQEEHGEQSPAAAAAAAVEQGAAASMQDFTVESDDEGDAVGTGGKQASAGGLSSGSTTAMQGPGGSSTGCPRLGGSLAWVVVSEHLASLHLAARSFEAAGSPEDAACLWRECHQTAGAFRVWGMQLLSCCGLAELACRRGDAEGAAAQLEASDCAWAQHKSECGDSRGGNALMQLLHTAQQAARARYELLLGRFDHAVRVCEEGLKACDGVLAEDAGREAKGRAEDGPGHRLTLHWQAVSLRCQVQRLKAETLARKGQRAEAVSLLQAAAGYLETAVSGYKIRPGGARRACIPARGSSSPPGAAAVWPLDMALVLSHSAAVASEAGLQGSPCLAGPAIVGLSCQSRWQQQAPSQTSTEGADVDVAVGDGATQSDQASKKGTGAKGKGAGGRGKAAAKDPIKANPGLTTPTSTTQGSAGPALAPLLRSLQLGWQVPLAATHACRLLAAACMQQGLLNATVMFMHLGHGACYAQQQAIQARPRWGLQQRASLHSGAGTAAACSPGPASVAAHGCCVRTAAMEVVQAALLAGEGADEGTLPGCGQEDSSGLVAALERGAAGWVQGALQVLPADGLIASVLHEDVRGGVLLGRLDHGCTPLVVQLPAAGHSTGGKGSSKGDCGEGDLGGCLAQFRRVLEDSSDSMGQVDQDAPHSQAHKAQWWKSRLSLDQRLQELLGALDHSCLRAWRCLLLPVPQHHRSVLLEAADAFLHTHLPALLEAGCGSDQPSSCSTAPAAVARELLVVVLAHMQHLSQEDVSEVVGVLCGGGKHADVSGLATELMAAEAAVRLQLLQLPAARAQGDAQSGGGSEGRASSSSVHSGDGATGDGARTIGGAVNRLAAACTGKQQPGASCSGGVRTGVAAVGARARAAAAARGQAAVAQVQVQEAVVGARGRRTQRLTAMQADASGPVACAQARGSTRTSVASASKSTTRSSQTVAHSTQAEAPSTPADAPTPHPPADNSSHEHATAAHTCPRQPVLLVLAHNLHALPWESIPCCRGQEVYRILSLPVACAQAQAQARMAAPTNAGGSDEVPCSNSGAASAGGSAYFVLNPSGDLADTQRTFQPLLEGQPGWRGLAGEAPSARSLLGALASPDLRLYLYLGHGSGEQFLPLPALRKLQQQQGQGAHRSTAAGGSSARVLLMGCSSGRLRQHGAYDPVGAVAAFALAGAPAVVANLWDVTDRDIDRYCLALLHKWLGVGTGAGAEGGSGSGLARSTMAGKGQAQQAGGKRTGKEGLRGVAQKAAETDEAVCGVGEGQGEVAGGSSLGRAVAVSRAACKLPHLIGAAPVCYGLPSPRA